MARSTQYVHRLRGLLAAPLSVAALCLAAIRPWFKLQTVCSDDFGFHLLRLVQLDTLLRQGVLYSRWAPDMALGYGYPFFNFYAPLAYYIAEIPRLLGLDLRIAVIATFALATIGAGLAAYRLARDHFSPRSSLVAAVAYAYAPYLAYDAYFRANLAETVAWVFPPLALWAIGRLARRGERRYLACTVLAYAATVLTHNVFALIFSPLLAAYGLATALARPPAPDAEGISRPPTLCRLVLTGGALLVGLGAAAFFWLPALAERSYVHSDRLLVPPVFVYWNNFIDLRELLAVPRAIHPDLLNPSPPRALGLTPVLLGLPALVGLRRLREPSQRVQVAFFAIALAIYAWLTTASSQFVWEHVPLLEYVQFPWRLLGPAALCLAMLIAAAAELLPANRRGSLLATAAIALLIVSALFWLEPRYCPDMEAPTPADIARFELATHTIGTTAKGEYLPRTVALVPEDAASTALDPASLPAGTTVAQQAGSPVGADLAITATQPFTAVYNGFHYPGWQVEVDGDPVPIVPDEPYGRITFQVPEGRHRVSIRLRETRLRLAADGVSLVCLALTVGALFWRGGRWRSSGRSEAMSTDARPMSTDARPMSADARPMSADARPMSADARPMSADARPMSADARPMSADASPHTEAPGTDQRVSPSWKPWAWAGWGLAILAAVVVLHQLDTPLRRPGLRWNAEGSPRLPNLDVELNTPFEGGLTLLGFNRERTTISSGDRLRLDLFWTPRESPTGRYKRAPVLIGPEGLRWNPKGTLPPRGFREPPPTYTWPVESYVQDSHHVETEPGTPPGTYDLYLTLFEQETLVPKRVLEAAGQPGPPELPLGQVTVTRPRRSPDPSEISVQHQIGRSLGPLTLLGVNLDRTEAAPGDPFSVTMFWLADETPTEDLGIRLALLAADGSPVATFDLPPTLATHPTSTWRVGDLWRGQHTRYLPAALEDGDYTWRLTLPPVDQSIALPPTLHVSAPPHTFTPPPVDVKMDTRLGEVATLVGANVEPGSQKLTSGTPLTLTLVWRADVETHTSYRVFVHLVDSDAALVAQSDGIPAAWARPTTGWLPGEYIADVHTVTAPDSAPPGDYTLHAGLYTPEGTRLTTSDGRDAVLVTTVIIDGQ